MRGETQFSSSLQPPVRLGRTFGAYWRIPTCVKGISSVDSLGTILVDVGRGAKKKLEAVKWIWVSTTEPQEAKKFKKKKKKRFPTTTMDWRILWVPMSWDCTLDRSGRSTGRIDPLRGAPKFRENGLALRQRQGRRSTYTLKLIRKPHAV